MAEAPSGLPAPCWHDVFVCSHSHLCLQGSSRAGFRECRSSAAARRPPSTVEILAYERGRGVFAGFAMGSGSLRPGNDTDEEVYGREVDAAVSVLLTLLHPRRDHRRCR